MCAKLGGALSVPTDVAQNALLQKMLMRSSHDRAWLGVRDRYSGRHHTREWLRCTTSEATATAPTAATGGCQQDNGNGGEAAEASRVTFQNWARRQPDDIATDCVELWTTGEWNDAPCSQTTAFFCAVPLVAVATAKPPLANADTDADGGADGDGAATFATFACSAHLQRRLGAAASECQYVLSARPGSQTRWPSTGQAPSRHASCHASCHAFIAAPPLPRLLPSIAVVSFHAGRTSRATRRPRL